MRVLSSFNYYYCVAFFLIFFNYGALSKEQHILIAILDNKSSKNFSIIHHLSSGQVKGSDQTSQRITATILYSVLRMLTGAPNRMKSTSWHDPQNIARRNDLRTVERTLVATTSVERTSSVSFLPHQ